MITATPFNDNDNVSENRAAAFQNALLFSIPEDAPSDGKRRSTSPRPSPRQARKAPRTGFFNNNHILVNQTRSDYNLKALKRSRALDEMARQHAKALAKKCTVKHSVNNVKELKIKLQRAHVAENVQRGDSVLAMHHSVMGQAGHTSRLNILGDFCEFGMATAKGSDGKLYMCQLFRK